MKCHFSQLCAVFFVYTSAHFFALRLLGLALCCSFFLYSFCKKYFFAFFHIVPQRQIYSFRISGVHGILLSQIIPLQYITFSLGCQVEFVLILFYYFSQHFITIFLARFYTQNIPHQHFIQKHQHPVGIVLDVSPTFLWDTNVKLTFYLT